MKNAKKVIAVLVAAAMVCSLAACSDSSSSKGKKDKKDKKGADTEAVVDAAEAYTKALKSMDSSKLKKLSTEIDEEFISDMEDAASEDDVKALFEAMLDKVEFEIDEDSADVDDDEASIKVEYTYCDISDFEVVDLDDFIDQIEDCDETKSGKFTLKFDVDDDEYLVSNADDVCETFYGDVVSFDSSIMSAGSGEVAVGDDEIDFSTEWIFSVFADSYTIGSTEDICFTISNYDYPTLEGVDCVFELTDENDKVLYTEYYTFENNGYYYITVSPSDIGATEFAPGEYTGTASLVDYDFYDYDYLEVEDSSSTVGGTTGTAATGASYVDGNTYYNETYGLKFDFSEDLQTIDPAMLGGALDGEDFSVDFICTSADQTSFIGFTMCGVVDGADQLTLEQLAEAMGANGADNTEVVTIDGMDFIYFTAEGYVYYMTLDGSEMFGLCFLSTDEYAGYIDGIVNSIEAI